MTANGGLLGMTLLATTVAARAEEAMVIVTADGSSVADELMKGLAQHAERFEEMKRRGAFTLQGRIEEIDGDGHASDVKEFHLRSTPTSVPMDRIANVFRYTENGKDKTEDAQKRARDQHVLRLDDLKDPDKRAKARKKDLKLPFLASEQARYAFSVVERDASRVRVAFTPKVPAENALKGSAWVDEKDGKVLSVGFSFSKNPMFVDHVDITVTFGLETELGRAPSTITFDGRGGFLFVRKHYRGSATLSQPAVVL